MAIKKYGDIQSMKIEFYVESIYYHPDNPIPSVVIVIRNNMDNLTPDEPVFIDSKTDMKKILRDLFRDSAQTHKTSFVVGLEKYRESKMRVGDRVEIEMTVRNSGEIAN